MKWLACTLFCITLGGLLLASCGGGPATTATSATTTTTTTTSGTMPVSTETTVEKPRYGGQIVVATTSNWQDFDEIVGNPGVFNHTMRLTSQELWIGDWSTGPAGSNENPYGDSRPMMFKTGDLAESWDFSGWDQGILTFKIRQGIHWAVNVNSEASRLVNGREVTADDVAFSFKQWCTTPTAYAYTMYPFLRKATITAPDKYTFKVQADPPTSVWFAKVTDFFRVVPHEVVEKYGNMKDWHNSVGSGPFMLTDVVDNSSVTFAKNPTYWAKDTGNAGKGNQLPYVDGVKFLVIVDTATIQSAFRTAKIDQLSTDWRDGPNFIKALPDVKYRQFPASGSPSATVMRTDKAPFNDVRVRKALFKALDFPTISNALTGPGSVYLCYPIGYSLTYKAAYLSLDDTDCPAEVKDIYTYDPAAAKQLLKDAGYPNGITGNIIVQNSTDVLDYYQTLQSYWAKAGIALNIDPREQGAWSKIMQSRSYDFMMYGSFSPISNLHACTSMYGNSQTNGSYVNDPVVNAARDKMMALDIKDDPTADAMHRELMKYVLAQCWVIPRSGGVSYSLWWPWLKQFYGSRTGWGHINTDNWVTWAWVDQSLKRSMGY